MRLTALILVLLGGFVVGAAEAHQFQVVSGTPAYFKFNTLHAASGVVQIKSSSDASLFGCSKHTHCFNVTAGPTGVSTSAKKVCSSRLGEVYLTVRSSNVASGWIRLQEISNAQKQNQVIEIPVGFFDPLVATAKKVVLTAGECTALTIKGGIKPYSFRLSGAETGSVNSQNEFCTSPSTYGISKLEIQDAAQNQVSTKLYVRGEVQSLSMDATRWQVTSGRGMPLQPTQEQDGSWSFQFPDISVGTVGYLTHSTAMGYLQGKALTARIRIEMSPGAEFDHHTEASNTSDYPAHVRMLLQRHQYFTSEANDRWWSNPIAVRLEQGEFVFRVPLTPDQWTNIWGRRGTTDATTLQGFQVALNEIGQIGFTFGGGFFSGHGVRVKNGTAKFVLTGFEIER